MSSKSPKSTPMPTTSRPSPGSGKKIPTDTDKKMTKSKVRKLFVTIISTDLYSSSAISLPSAFEVSTGCRSRSSSEMHSTELKSRDDEDDSTES